MNNTFRSRSLLVLVTAGLAAACGSTLQPGVTPPTSGLSIVRHTNTALEGSYSRSGSVVSFSSTVEASRAVLSLNVVGKQVEATLDESRNVATIDPHGREFSNSDTQILDELEGALDSYFSSRGRQLTVNERILTRVVAFLSEAPNSIPLMAHAITRPPEIDGSSGVLPDKVPEAENCVTPASESADPRSCQQADNDGIAYLPCNAVVSVCYDAAAAGQCFLCEPIFVGPRAVGCMGRCGPGCGSARGLGLYTQDCADHDRCCRRYGGCLDFRRWHCGDEYWEASDDFVWSRRNSNCRP